MRFSHRLSYVFSIIISSVIMAKSVHFILTSSPYIVSYVALRWGTRHLLVGLLALRVGDRGFDSCCLTKLAELVWSLRDSLQARDENPSLPRNLQNWISPVFCSSNEAKTNSFGVGRLVPFPVFTDAQVDWFKGHLHR